MICVSRSCSAGFDLTKVITEPLGVRDASSNLADSLDRTLQQLSALIGKADGVVAQRLEQVRSIVKDALSGEKELIDKATHDNLIYFLNSIGAGGFEQLLGASRS